MESRNQEDKRALSVLRTRHRTRCCSQAIAGQTRRKLNKLRDFLRVFFIFDAILGGWGGGRGGRLLDKGRLLERGV